MKSLEYRFIKQYRSIRYQLFKQTALAMPPADETVEIDVILPVIEKDLRTLPLCLEGINRAINHPIRAIYLIAPVTHALTSFAATHNLQFVNENEVLGYSPKKVGFVTDDGTNRSGWIFQQLLKLAGNVGTSRYYLTVDADHILLSPHTFITPEGKYVLYRSREFHPPYRRSIRSLLGKCSTSLFDLSFVAHKMLFDRQQVGQLHHTLETRHAVRWDRAILRSLNTDSISPFSEFEMYGNFLDPSSYLSQPWREKSLSYRQMKNYDELRSTYGSRYAAVTFPEYEQEF